MAKVDIFTNQTTDATVQAQTAKGTPITVYGFFQVDVVGVLDGADVLTQYRHSNKDASSWITIADGSWYAAADPAPILPDGSLMQLDGRFIRFVLQNAGASTDITLSVSYD